MAPGTGTRERIQPESQVKQGEGVARPERRGKTRLGAILTVGAFAIGGIVGGVLGYTIGQNKGESAATNHYSPLAHEQENELRIISNLGNKGLTTHLKTEMDGTIKLDRLNDGHFQATITVNKDDQHACTAPVEITDKYELDYSLLYKNGKTATSIVAGNPTEAQAIVHKIEALQGTEC